MTCVSTFGKNDVLWVTIAKENGRAYPDYLIRYYRGKGRDSKRTPFTCREHAGVPRGPSMVQTRKSGTNKSSRSNKNMGGGVGVGVEVTDSVWEYLGDTGWEPYSFQHQQDLEAKYRVVHSSTGGRTTNSLLVHVTTDQWNYTVDVVKMTQRNIQHESHKERSVRRRTLSSV